MDDIHMTAPKPVQPSEKGPTTIKARFYGFAAGHITLSGLLAPFLFLLGSLLGGSELFFSLAPALLMGIYFPLGIVVALWEEWTVPRSARERVLAVLQPAAVAWIWAAVVLVTLWSANPTFLMPVFFLSFCFASPSSAVVLLSFGTAPSGAGLFAYLSGVACLVGFLPPLLFALGSWFQARRREKKKRE